jgi:hypothetical protein
MTSIRRSLTDEEREERRVQQRELVTASIEQLRTSDGWRAYLRTRTAFRSYSPRHAWRDAGAVAEQRPRTHWRLASVFAQDQIAELPPPAVVLPLDPPAMAEILGDSHADRLDDLRTLITDIGYQLKLTDTGAAEGRHYATGKLIEISDQLQVNGQLAAGIHEVGHALIALDDLAPTLSYPEEELIVESVAYCVCQTLGLATDANSIPYLTGWAEQADLDVLERSAQLTSRLADRIEAALLPASEEGDGSDRETPA